MNNLNAEDSIRRFLKINFGRRYLIHANDGISHVAVAGLIAWVEIVLIKFVV